MREEAILAKIYLVEGPVGAGKSTYSKTLGQSAAAPHFNLDAWMARLFRPDRPESEVMQWYIERKKRCIEQIWDVALRTLNANCDVILELGLIRSRDRHAMYERIKASGHEVIIHILDAPREERRKRVNTRNVEKGETFSMEVPDTIFDMASDMWQAPDEFECEEQEVVFVSQGNVHQ